jgi:epoxyqueuosine reductase
VSLTSELKTFARNLGFHLVGITSADPFSQAELDITRWLSEGHQGEMGWLNAARARLATRPHELLPQATSLIVVGASYRTVEPDSSQSSVRSRQSSTLRPQPRIPGPLLSARGRVARYAWGEDYHDAMKQRLRLTAEWLSQRVDRPIQSRVFVDDGPLVERDAAVRAGVGFRGKNTNLLTTIGSYVFLGALLTDVELDLDSPITKDCGTCRLCIEACPTQALDEAYHLAAERCIAYLTIEHRGPIAEDLRPKLGNWIFGCDICQEVCPYNASTRGRPRGWPEFEPRRGTTFDLEVITEMDDAAFRAAFRGTPIKRTKRRGLVRNAALALGNVGGPGAASSLARLADDPDPVVAEAARWALKQPRSTS